METHAGGADAMMLAAFHADLATVKAQIASGYKLKTRNVSGEERTRHCCSDQSQVNPSC